MTIDTENINEQCLLILVILVGVCICVLCVRAFNLLDGIIPCVFLSTVNLFRVSYLVPFVGLDL